MSQDTKLQKFLAEQGIASRREVERWIVAGRIKVDNQLAHLGQRVTGAEKIEVDGRILRTKSEGKTQVLLYNKPEGELCSRSDPEGRPLIFDKLPRPKQGRLITVGRLDINSTGLLLLTNNGALANQLMHPSNHYDREYAVRIFGTVTDEIAKRLVKGIQLEDGFARFEHIVAQGGDGRNQWYHVVIMQGRQRIVRRLFEAVGLTVSRLIRVRFGPIALPRELHMGECMWLDEKGIQDLEGYEIS